MANLLGAKIKELRKAKGLTLEQLAEQIGSGKSYIWEIENRGVKRPSAEKLSKIAQALGVTTDYLIDETRTTVNDETLDRAFFRQYQGLDEDNKKKIRDLVEVWSKK